MPRRLTCSVAPLRFLVGWAAARGAAVDGLCAGAGLTGDVLASPDARVPWEVGLRVWQELPRAVGDPDFGLHAAQAAGQRPDAFPLLDYAVRNCRTVGDALTTIVRYQRIFHDAAGFRLTMDGAGARLVHAPPPEVVVPRHAAEFLFGTLLVGLRQRTGRDLVPMAVRFRHPAPPSVDEHHRLFGRAVAFGAPNAELLLAREAVDLPVLGADPQLRSLLEQLAEQALARNPAEESVLDEVRRALVAAMPGGDTDVESIARRLGMSRRSLQRALQAEGVTYQELFDDLRRQLALTRLGEERRPPGEVAFLLGFADVAAFYRAFRRWTGTTPGAYVRGADAEVAQSPADARPEVRSARPP
jgi:AraC-like DNA-binding protein